MTDKAYIVANEEQVAKIRATAEFKRDFDTISYYKFPYVLIYSIEVWWLSYQHINNAVRNHDAEIVYDGRKESKVKISKKVYDALVEWRDANHLDHTHINGGDLLRLPTFILNFWLELGISQNEANNRLIAIIRWVNGEDVFEVEKPKKWVVRSRETDDDNAHGYVYMNEYGLVFNRYHIEDATKFDTKEEAESWANAHQEVVEVEG